ncbi:hypothetical protein M9H77_01882 [Catharanthus roseus]|uniref:Uncharacterized protein n=1 Tax=Catharanthus roseus TaxID=4058 RepID=A0ACC0C6Y2_CATRO|nr:hypothetical protein M9H77_01882 [Catharanthus roseus]
MKREQEDSSIQLIHMMMTCAGRIQRGNLSLACTLAEKLQGLFACMDSTSAIGKVASYFIDALNYQIFTASQGINSVTFPPEKEILYHNFHEATPYLKFAHFTANQAILEAFQGHDFVHALALRPEGPPFLCIPGIPSDCDSVEEICCRLAEFARSINVNLAFRGVLASRPNEIKPWLLQAKQEVDHNQSKFLDRFTEALFYYSTMFDSLEASSAQPEKARTERHEPLAKWRDRSIRAGFKPLQLGHIAFEQASMMLSLFLVEGYCVEEKEGCLILSWHGRPLIATSAWESAMIERRSR